MESDTDLSDVTCFYVRIIPSASFLGARSPKGQGNAAMASDLDQELLARQRRRLEGDARRIRLLEILGIDAIDVREIGDIQEVNRRPDDVLQTRARRLQRGGDVFDALAGLGFDVAFSDELVVPIHRGHSGNIDHRSGAELYGLRVGADGRRKLRTLEGLRFHHSTSNFVIKSYAFYLILFFNDAFHGCQTYFKYQSLDGLRCWPCAPGGEIGHHTCAELTVDCQTPRRVSFNDNQRTCKGHSNLVT